ncbi:hypothetical protein [Mesorhizobium sp. M8A.F.Ca.ET.021.01.1.1]|uniref:hypothetical protein n=1 Tax=Mesorhizobium sp. M8A.F.Ca.ET.021.01.1.1 TaxID=2496757 RepID=UPI001FE07A89|nr:hypothetical protein [Mesorhizobium sp. M8A.F.Ca.ET.021.01.1.1]
MAIVATRPANKILIVEDEFLIALHLADLLVEMGYRIAGPVDNLDEAIVFARDEEIDFAILDINLAGTRFVSGRRRSEAARHSVPVCERIRERWSSGRLSPHNHFGQALRSAGVGAGNCGELCHV